MVGQLGVENLAGSGAIGASIGATACVCECIDSRCRADALHEIGGFGTPSFSVAAASMKFGSPIIALVVITALYLPVPFVVNCLYVRLLGSPFRWVTGTPPGNGDGAPPGAAT